MFKVYNNMPPPIICEIFNRPEINCELRLLPFFTYKCNKYTSENRKHILLKSEILEDCF